MAAEINALRAEIRALVVSNPAPSATVANTLGTSDLLGSAVVGFSALSDALDARLTALQV
jgi:hypothetical protein